MRFRVRALVLLVAGITLGLYALCAFSLIFLKWVNPWTTAVQTERRVDALLHGRPYHKHYKFVPMGQISPDRQHAVVSAEDERFREHSGVDWIELKKAMDLKHGKMTRGASTISQQL